MSCSRNAPNQDCTEGNGTQPSPRLQPYDRVGRALSNCHDLNKLQHQRIGLIIFMLVIFTQRKSHGWGNQRDFGTGAYRVERGEVAEQETAISARRYRDGCDPPLPDSCSLWTHLAPEGMGTFSIRQ